MKTLNNAIGLKVSLRFNQRTNQISPFACMYFRLQEVSPSQSVKVNVSLKVYVSAIYIHFTPTSSQPLALALIRTVIERYFSYANFCVL